MAEPPGTLRPPSSAGTRRTEGVRQDGLTVAAEQNELRLEVTLPRGDYDTSRLRELQEGAAEPGPT